MAVVTCPICKNRFDSETTTVMPFCSPRCQKIDLGRWLGEQYGMPVERSDEDEDEFFDSNEHN